MVLKQKMDPATSFLKSLNLNLDTQAFNKIIRNVKNDNNSNYTVKEKVVHQLRPFLPFRQYVDLVRKLGMKIKKGENYPRESAKGVSAGSGHSRFPREKG